MSRTDHAEINRACAALREAARDDDRQHFAERYRVLEQLLATHMAAEEEKLLPDYERQAPEDAAALLRQHEELRRQLTAIGVEVQLHCIRAQTIDALVATLAAHAAHEDQTLYQR